MADGPMAKTVVSRVAATAEVATNTPAELDRRAREAGLDFAADLEAVADLAAIALTVDVWRAPDVVEHLQARPAGVEDADMFRLNVATWRAVRRCVGLGGVDLQALVAVLSDGQRWLPGCRRVTELLGDEFGALVDDVAVAGRQLEHAVAKVGSGHVFRTAALVAVPDHVSWYGTPWWPLIVEQLLEDAGDALSAGRHRCTEAQLVGPATSELAWVAAKLRARPEDLDLATLRWCLTMGIGGLGGDAYNRWRSRR